MKMNILENVIMCPCDICAALKDEYICTFIKPNKICSTLLVKNNGFDC